MNSSSDETPVVKITSIKQLNELNYLEKYGRNYRNDDGEEDEEEKVEEDEEKDDEEEDDDDDDEGGEEGRA